MLVLDLDGVVYRGSRHGHGQQAYVETAVERGLGRPAPAGCGAEPRERNKRFRSKTNHFWILRTEMRALYSVLMI